MAAAWDLDEFVDSKKIAIPPAIELPKVQDETMDFQTMTLRLRPVEGALFEVVTQHPDGQELIASSIMPERSDDWEGMGAALLPEGEIRQYFLTQLEALRAKEKGIRIQIDFLGETKRYAIWHWEALKINDKHLLSDPHISISRTVSSKEPALSFTHSDQTYNLLCVVPAPKVSQEDQTSIEEELMKEIEAIRKVLKPLERQGLLSITILNGRKASLEGLKNELDRGEKSYHALYLSCGGLFGYRHDETAKNGPDGALILDDGHGRIHKVFGAQLGQLLRESSVRLVCIGAVCSAYGSDPKGQGVAEMISKAGIPAVVGFQEGVIYSQAFENFAEAFFSNLPKSNSLDRALLAGRKAIEEFPPASWAQPKFFTRIEGEERVFSGEIGKKISTIVNEKGEVEFVRYEGGEADLEMLKRQQESLTRHLQHIEDIVIQEEIQRQILDATRSMQRGNSEQAIGILSEASMKAVATIKRQEAEAKKLHEEQERRWAAEAVAEKKLRRKQIERFVVLLLAAAMIAVVAFFASFAGEGSKIDVLGLPVPVVLWSFIGGVGATLYAFVGTQKYEQTEALRLDWLIGRPLVGVIMGSVVYLAVATSLSAVGDVNTAESKAPYLLWALSFIGGFSDKFAILLFDNLVGKFTRTEKEEEGKEGLT